jgi:CheY-like chemotaxis protein
VFHPATRRGILTKRSGTSVLCIGNDPVSLNFRCSHLQQCGWTVSSSGSGHEGIKQLDREPFDAVVIDLNDDGAEAALITGQIKKMKPEVPVVIVVNDPKLLVAGATKQADAVVSKAQEKAHLPDILSRLCNPG